MERLTQPGRQGLDIAIIGGGASGTLAAAQLLRRAASRRLPMRITLIDRHGRHGLGQAYSTGHRAHLLNAMACQMSALPDDPDHLLRWATADAPSARTDPDASAGRRAGARLGAVTPTTFLPRQDYGRYLRDTLADAEHQAMPVARLTRVNSEVLAVRRASAGRPLRLILPDGQIEADIAVLATGNTPARLPFAVPLSERIITDPWLPGALAPITGSTGTGSTGTGSTGTGTGAADGGSVVILGTGLTMLDLALAITASAPDVVVHAVSRHGLLPRPHPGARPASRQPLWLPVITRTTGPVRLGDLMWQVRSAIGASPGHWYDVIDALRPLVPGLWRRMPAEDKRLFLRHVARYWEVHRHLVPPATASRITALRATGRLRIHRGQVMAVTQDAERLLILVDAGADTLLQLEADWLINGTGSTADIAATASPLLHDLFTTGLARPDPLRLGIDASPDGAVLTHDGSASDVLFTLGPPLRGLWYETTAIPEIREQAAALARRLTSERRLSQRPDSAA
jgi:uncharacterized NAD(P)/FAD-binding protein YdhS